MADPSASITSGLSSPARNGLAVTPSDTVDLTTVARGLYVGGAGDVIVNMAGGQTSQKFASVAAGTILPIVVTRVISTNTTATNIVALW